MSRSFTSRRAREGEIDGVDYNFVTRDRFEAMVSAGASAVHVTANKTLLFDKDELIALADKKGIAVVSG